MIESKAPANLLPTNGALQALNEEQTLASPSPLDDAGWTMVIRPKAHWLQLRFDELWQYRDLIGLFVRRDFVAAYKQTVLGPLWHIIQPLFTALTFTFIFGNIAGVSTDGLPKFLFYMAGTVSWSYFAKCLASTADTFVANAGIFGKVYFPRLAIPVSIIISALISFGIQFGIFLFFMAYFGVSGADLHPNNWILLTPVLLLLMAGLGLGFGIIVSSLTTRYRDLRHLVAFGVQLFMYATPVIYPLSTIPEEYRNLIMANPMTPIIETFRFAYLGAGTVSAMHLLYSAGFTVVVLLAGIFLFNKVERTFMDTV